MILAAVVACAIAGVMVLSMTKRSRRAPMRMPNELDDDDTEMLLGTIRRPESPIDRTVQILDLEPIAREPARGQAPSRGSGQGSGQSSGQVSGQVSYPMPADGPGRAPSETR
ncbi:hypothetical protein [Methylobacterium planeticum]|uniref:Uncharacterized protein n=1 Tax=Methylobacterium planeticum TaxID=2615211 RepID=A0A6N6MXY3_9HYPH|nr:hypothetical protein [Methylobacterium planeticum]KAB1075716.1 hypothetical protein F6X51_03355 [Methylobacterium planeticum]